MVDWGWLFIVVDDGMAGDGWWVVDSYLLAVSGWWQLRHPQTATVEHLRALVKKGEALKPADLSSEELTQNEKLELMQMQFLDVPGLIVALQLSQPLGDWYLFTSMKGWYYGHAILDERQLEGDSHPWLSMVQV